MNGNRTLNVFAAWLDALRKKPFLALLYLVCVVGSIIAVAVVLSSPKPTQPSVDHGKIIDCLEAQYSYAFSGCGRAPPYELDSNNYFCYYKGANNRTNAVLITCIYLSDLRYAQNGSLVSVDAPFCGPAMNGVYEELSCEPSTTLNESKTIQAKKENEGKVELRV